MQEEGPSNIFEQAAKELYGSASRKKTKKKPGVTKLSKPQKEPIQKTEQPLPPSEIDPVMRNLQKMREIHNALEAQLEAIYEKSGLRPETIKRYLQNRENFTAEEWDLISKHQQYWQERIQFLSEGIADKKTFIPLEEKKLAQKRKAKTIGGRKGWIPMR